MTDDDVAARIDAAEAALDACERSDDRHIAPLDDLHAAHVGLSRLLVLLLVVIAVLLVLLTFSKLPSL